MYQNIWRAIENKEGNKLNFSEIGRLSLKNEGDNSVSYTGISANGKFLSDTLLNQSLDETTTVIFKWLPQDVIANVCGRLRKTAFTEEEWKSRILSEPYNQTCVNAPYLQSVLHFYGG